MPTIYPNRLFFHPQRFELENRGAVKATILDSTCLKLLQAVLELDENVPFLNLVQNQIPMLKPNSNQSAGLALVSLIALLLPTFDLAAQETYELDNSHTSMVFAISHFNLSYTYGRFGQCSGEFTLDGGMADSFKFNIASKSIDTNDKERDKHLRGPDFFDADVFPAITFVSKEITRSNETYYVVGDMTMLGQTKEVTLPMQLIGVGKGPFGKQRAGFFTKFKIKRSDFGMNKMMQAVGDTVAITFSFEGIKKEAKQETASDTDAANVK